MLVMQISTAQDGGVFASWLLCMRVFCSTKKRRCVCTAVLLTWVGLVGGCDSGSQALSDQPSQAQDDAVQPAVSPARQGGASSSTQKRNLYFGDLHVHTAISMDAILWGNRVGMEEAYGFARGESITLPSGATTRISAPLDFVALTDHASSFETTEFCFSGNAYPNADGLCERFEKPSNAYFETAMKRLRQRPVTRYSGFCEDDEDVCLKANAKTWQRVQAAANEANEPGKFTTFVSYEYSPALPKQGKIHRNVFFRGTQVPDNAISIYDAQTEVDLWKSLTSTCVGECKFLTIPHNLNLTWGYGFAMQTIDGDLYTDDDLRLRASSEPLAEIFQSKGASECALGLGATDEECGFEQILSPCLEEESEACALSGSFVREGLKRGLELQAEKGINPFKVGFVGSTDTHNSNPGDTEEADYPGAMGMLDDTAEERLRRDKKRHPRSDRNVLYYNPGGLAAIWADENTRESLFDAMQRREVYATSGTRIALRMYAGWDLASLDKAGANFVQQLPVHAVPMGGDLGGSSSGTAPQIFVWAAKDVHSANLQRIQIIKGWLEDGELKESVEDIVCSDGGAPDAVTKRCPANGATVDLKTCLSNEDTGAAELQTLWHDENFDPSQQAFYYARVIENPLCRWSTHDALRLARELKPQVSGQIQERAWSSPIWYVPGG